MIAGQTAGILKHKAEYKWWLKFFCAADAPRRQKRFSPFFAWRFLQCWHLDAFLPRK